MDIEKEIVVAVIGCLHGELDRVYSLIERIQNRDGIQVDLVLCCGDFQSARDVGDLNSMAIPPKFRKLGDFSKYYYGEVIAPFLTVFVGGNHEASSYLWELPYGGWVAPNIYYMGYSNVLNFAGYKIGGISGIYKHFDFQKGHFEKLPLNSNTLRSIYHIRKMEIDKLLITQPEALDLLISHDWPCEIWNYGSVDELLSKKPFFKNDVENNTIGCKELMELIKVIKPKQYVSAHMHVFFKATVNHGASLNQDSEVEAVTEFMALDKPLPRRKYLEILKLGPAKGESTLTYDPLWLAITKAASSTFDEPCNSGANSVIDHAQVEDVKTLFCNDFTVPLNFSRPENIEKGSERIRDENIPILNQQTAEFCKKLQIKNPCDFYETTINPDAIDLGF